MTVLLVDWLGRGGIAQVTESWALELKAGGVETAVVTRPGRELGQGSVRVRDVPDRKNRLLAHATLVRAAVQAVHELRPTAVVLQNHVLPPMEAAVDLAARQAGAIVVRVVHDHRLHSRWAGTQLGIRRLLQRADVVLAHTRYVGDRVAADVGREVELLPHPVQVGVLAHEVSPLPVVLQGDGDLALHFGVVHRGYKGTDVIIKLAEQGVPGWRLGVLGAGAPTAAGLATVPGFVSPGVLVAAVRASTASLLPYRFATQSGAVVLAQALGSVPIATAVGGLPEQIEDGETGILLPPGADVGAWHSALASLDEPTRRGLAERAVEHVWAAHARFSARVVDREREVTTGIAAVLTVLHERPERLARRFADLARQDHSIDEVIVAAPAEDHPVIAAAVPPAAPFVVRLVDNPGGERSAGLNLAARSAAAEILVRVDARSAISPTHVSICSSVLRKRPEVGVVGGPQRPVAGGDDEVARGIARALANPWALGGAAYRRVDRAGPVDTVYLGAFRRLDLLDIGGYDERLEANEDFDLCQRFRQAGAVVWLDPAAGVAYECRTSLRSVALQYFAFGRSKARYWRLTGTRAQARQRVPLVGLAAAVVVLGWIIRRPRRAPPVGVAALVGVTLVDTLGSRQPAPATVRAITLCTYPVVWAAWTIGVVEGRIRDGR